jgi:hypothetical protein
VVLDEHAVDLRRFLGGPHESERLDALVPGLRVEDSPLEFPDHRFIVFPGSEAIKRSDPAGHLLDHTDNWSPS